MRLLLIGLLILLALIMIMGVVAWSLGGVWGLLGAFAVLIFVVVILKQVAGKLITMAFTAPFKMKGKVLRAAVVTVHSVTPTGKPNRSVADEDEEADADMFDSPEEAEEYQHAVVEERREQEEADSRRQWFLLDLTITPQEVTGEGFRHWEPGDLAIVSPASKPAKTFGPDDEEEAIGEVFDVSIWHPERQEFCEDDMCKYHGPQRLRMHVGVEPGHDRLSFRYYFEQFGDVKLTSG